jgi:nitrate/TMAO reductase-like tetraheme cytochrome c subunit
VLPIIGQRLIKLRGRIGLVIVILVLGIGASSIGVAHSDSGSASQSAASESEICAACHAKEYNAWQGSAHANPSLVPERHKEWGEGPVPEYCSFCHPNGIDTSAGPIATTGVTCVSCHGPYTDDHPPVVMPIQRTTEFCGSCHSATFHEWQSSGHGRQGITCVSCHAVHSQTTRAAEGQFLCISCHAERFHDFSEAAHGKANLTCVRCHMGDRPHDVEGVRTTSRVSPSHTFVAQIEVCLECHRDTIHNSQAVLTPGVEATSQPSGTLTAPLPIATSPPIASSRPSPAGTLDVTWAGGALAGLLLGFAVAWVTIRGRPS